ncbi:MAG: MBL fold metallo-hydrolase RNA specificity domain-containing protein [Burkholderiaceae bacterium]
MKLTFLGAAGTVTGSKYLLETGGLRILVDCGLFQGYKNLRLLNWQPLPVRPTDIDAVVLTHAHLDHSGALPLLVREGYRGPVLTTHGTRELCGLLLPDSGHLQEADAEFANRHKTSRHQPALPLYTEEDAHRALKLFKPLDFDEPLTLGALQLRLRPAGHILGASSVELRQGKRTLLMSGDIGRPDDLMMKPPVPIAHADTLVIESTYGDRQHDDGDHAAELADVIRRTAARGGMVIIPAFAVGRAQALLYQIWLLKQANRIPDLPVFLDSPMAIDTTGIYQRHANEHRLSVDECRHMAQVARFCRTPDQSRELNQLTYPAIIISASGMATGGRILHHLMNHLGDRRCSVVFAGFQAGGTRGARLVAGERSIRIFGQDVAVNAEVVSIPGMSAHADAAQIIQWLGTWSHAPRHIYITHGEHDAADALRRRIQRELGWRASVPMMGDCVDVAMAV